MKIRILQLAPGMLTMCLLASPCLHAQIESGTITGQVTDSQGAAVAAADVTATNIGTGAAVETKTKADGTYAFATLHPSRYKLTVLKEGFKVALNDDVDVHVQDKLAINFVLSVGSKFKR